MTGHRHRAGAVDAILLDIGGVMLIPDVVVLHNEFSDADFALRQDDFFRAHYVGVAALDDFGNRPGAWAHGYVEGVLDGLGLGGSERERLRDVLTRARRLRDLDLWRWPIPGSFEAIRMLTATAVRVAFVSNSDGTAEEKLVTMGLSQVGPGPGVAVDAIFDSTIVGVAKPDPAFFAIAVDALGVSADRSLYVGDSRLYDVDGARAAGLVPWHFDPFAVCNHGDHDHLADLKDLLDLV